MLVTVMQVLDVTVTNVALPHIQGSLSAGVDEVSWVLTSYLAANAVILPATGWLAGVLGRKRLLPRLHHRVHAGLGAVRARPQHQTLLIARILQGIGGGPLMPLSQAIMWEIFPLRQRGMAMAAWGVGIMMAPIFGPTLGGWISDNWSWRWIFYINLPIGIVGLLVASAVLFDPRYLKKPGRIDVARAGAHGAGLPVASSSSSTRASATSGSTPRSSLPWPSWPWCRSSPSWSAS